MKDFHKESLERLRQIEKAINAIKQYTERENSDSFCNTPMLHDAVLLQFVIIGEAIVNVESQLLIKYKYPWYKVKSFRNMIAHQYFDIKIPAVWLIIERDLPALDEVITKMLENEF
jgi:uncharacterized protein with HEPN domain